MFLVLAAAATTTTVVALGVVRRLFTPDHRLVVPSRVSGVTATALMPEAGRAELDEEPSMSEQTQRSTTAPPRKCRTVMPGSAMSLPVGACP